MSKCFNVLLWVAGALGAGLPQAAEPPSARPLPTLAPWSQPGSDRPAAPWRISGLPGTHKPVTEFSLVTLDGQRVLRVAAQASYGLLLHELPGLSHEHWLSWRWRLDEANPTADLRQRAADDSPIKVCASFQLPLTAVPFVERQVLRLARLRAQEDLPAATVCYVWDAHLPAGTVLDNAFSRRLRYIVLHGPEAPLHTWQTERRDLHADFLRLFGDESRTVPPLRAVAVGADADNTQGHSLAHVDALRLD